MRPEEHLATVIAAEAAGRQTESCSSGDTSLSATTRHWPPCSPPQTPRPPGPPAGQCMASAARDWLGKALRGDAKAASSTLTAQLP